MLSFLFSWWCHLKQHKLFNFDKCNSSIFPSVTCALDVSSELLCNPRLQIFIPVYFSEFLIFSSYIGPLIHSELIFVYCMWLGSASFFCMWLSSYSSTIFFLHYYLYSDNGEKGNGEEAEQLLFSSINNNLLHHNHLLKGLFFMELSWHPCWKSSDHKYKDESIDPNNFIRF